ncbi:MAG: Ig-like domain-containing protein [Planctomycetota bacterium]
MDYSLDTNGFFDSQLKKDVFQTAADSVASQLTDSLSAITPGASGMGFDNTWTASFSHPATGLTHELIDLDIAANTLVVFAGGRDLAGSAAGIGGPGGAAVSGTTDFADLVVSRGQTGALEMPATDFGPWGGSITFDTTIDWHFGLTTDGLEASETDFISVAQHEIAHLLGFGTASSWNTHVSDGDFTGPEAVTEFGSDIPLHSDDAHWAAETMSDGRLAAMTPVLLNGTRNLFTPLDFTALSDIGWSLTTPADLDYGDAPDNQAGSDIGDYQTLAFDAGPAHAVTMDLFLGAVVDADNGLLQSLTALADDVDGNSPGDEDGVASPFDLAATIGESPQVTLSATNSTGTSASLYGWIDYNQDGVFDNVTERAVIPVPTGTAGEFFTLTFPQVPDGSAGTTYARFRLSTDASAAESTGFALDGEVEDYRVVITRTATTSIQNHVTINSTSAGISSIDNLDLFGGAVTALGDLNGDGVPDVAVGAYGDDTGGTNRGAVHVLFLNADGSIDSTQLIAHNTAGGPALSNDDRFGRSVAAIGDINGDGIVDLAVGADGDSSRGTSRGAVYILFLNADGTVKSHRRIGSTLSGGPSLANGDGFGRSVTRVGDLDGDGIHDIAVGAPYDSSRGPLRGAAYILFLDTDGSVKSHQKIGSSQSGGPALSDGDRFAISMTSVDDVNGDGIIDLAIGADRHDTAGVESGGVHVLFLNRDGTVSSSQTIARNTGGGPALSMGDRFGSSVTDIGDLNGDGIHELAVGAYRDDSGGTDRGAIHILFLSPDGTSSQTVSIDSTTDGGPALLNQDRFGASVASIGDLDGDGLSELIVGADGDDSGGSAYAERGAAHILFLTPPQDYGDAPDPAPGTDSEDYRTTHDDNGPAHAVDSRLSLGVNIDADSGVLQNATADADDVDGALPDDEDGIVSILDLAAIEGSSPTVTVLVSNSMPAEARLYGWIDYNQDGVFDNSLERADITIPAASGSSRYVLTFSVVPENSAGTTYARFRLSTDPAAADPIGPVDDGEVEDYPFEIFAASGGYARSVTQISSGVNGGPTLADGDRFGDALVHLGDIDGDGVSDIAVGAPRDDTGGSIDSARGAVHVVLLNTDGTVKGSTRIASDVNGGPSIADEDQFGASIASPGDLDGDGVNDLLVGAPGDDTAGDQQGAVYVMYLNTDGSVKSSLKIADTSNGGPDLLPGDRFGESLTSLGDLDGDGVTDVAVGTPGDDTGGNERGAVHVLFLNADGSVKATQKIAHGLSGGPVLADNDRFGDALSTIGDLNGDGIEELAVGAPSDSSVEVNGGAVYVLFMNADGTVGSETIIAGETNGGPALPESSLFGSSLAATGDQNGDGINDLVVGAAGGNTSGSAYVLYLDVNGNAQSTRLIARRLGGGPPLSDGDGFGSAIAAIGDLDGDGISDLAIGASAQDAGGMDRGAVYMLNLGAPDTEPPTVTVDIVDDALNDADSSSTVTFDFSEAVERFDLSGVTVIGGVLDSLVEVDSDSFTATFTADDDVDTEGSVTVDGLYTDLAANAGSSESDTVIIDRQNPTVAVMLDDSSLTSGETAQITFTFSEVPVGFDSADVTVQSGDLSNLSATGDPLVFTATFTPTAGVEAATNVIGVSTGFEDDAGNQGIDATSSNYAVDTLAPSPAITPDATTTGDDPIVFTIQFSEAVTGFDAGDVSAMNGTKGVFASIDGATYTIEVTPTTAGEVTIDIPGSVAVDAAGNASQPGTASVTFQTEPMPASVTLPAAGSYEVLRDGDDLVVRDAAETELFRQPAAAVSVLNIAGTDGNEDVTVLDLGIAVDSLIVFSGNDGDDRFDALTAMSSVTLMGNGGDDTLTGGTDDDVLQGGSGKDELIGNAGDDVLLGQGSTGDTLDGGDGDDTLNGGSGNDVIRETLDGDAVLTNTTLSGRGADSIISVERAALFGGTAAQSFDVSSFFAEGLTSTTLIGGGGDDTLAGSPGSDVLNGEGGNDLIDAGTGNDRTFGGAGSDTLIGGAGNDLLRGLGGTGDQLSGGEGDDTINGGRGVDRLFESGDVDFTLTNSSMTGLGNDLIQAMEIAQLTGGASANVIDVSAFSGFRGFTQLRGQGGDDSITGSSMTDVILGGDGNDTLLGKQGDDTLRGEDGNDGLSGFDGDDVLEGGRGFDRGFGGLGNDTLSGGAAIDTLFGGEGDDSLTGDDGTDTLVGGTGNNDASLGDLITDATASIDEAFTLDPLPGWVDQV